MSYGLGTQDVPGSGKRAQRKREARLFDGAVKHRARYTGRFASLATFKDAPTPLYRVRPIRDDDAPHARSGARVCVEYRPPKRRIPDHERPSRVVVTKSS